MARREDERRDVIRLTVPDVTEEDLAVVQDVLKSGYLVQGVKVQAFEEVVADYLGVPHAVAVSSCTAALHLSLLALGIGPGDEVIVPDFTFPATVNAVELVGAKPIFCDIAETTYCIDVEKIVPLITTRTKAVMPVHEFGCPAEMKSIMAIAERYGLLVIEDAACALGTEYEGRKAGTFGSAGCFSFHPRKAVTTGEGGIVSTSDGALAERLRCLRNHGMSNNNGRIEFVAAGYNYRMTDLQGALGIVQMKKLPRLIDRRIELAAVYDDSFRNVDLVKTPSCGCGGRHVYQTYHLLLKQSTDRDLLVRDLRAHGIESNYGAYAVHLQQYYRQKYHCDESICPVSVNAFYQGLALPMHPALSSDDIRNIATVVVDLVQEQNSHECQTTKKAD